MGKKSNGFGPRFGDYIGGRHPWNIIILYHPLPTSRQYVPIYFDLIPCITPSSHSPLGKAWTIRQQILCYVDWFHFAVIIICRRKIHNSSNSKKPEKSLLLNPLSPSMYFRLWSNDGNYGRPLRLLHLIPLNWNSKFAYHADCILIKGIPGDDLWVVGQ